MTRTSGSPLPPIRLDPSIRNQALRVGSGLRAAIFDGLLLPGARLPSSRELAAQLNMGRNSVVAAYEHLVNDGLIEGRPGSGTFVTQTLPSPPKTRSVPKLSIDFGPRRPFALGQTHVEPSFLARLGVTVRRRISEATFAELAYGDPRGSLLLRQEISNVLAVRRGIRCDPDCVIVVSGTQHGLRICADALLHPGDSVWVEEPGYSASRVTLDAAGGRIVPAPVDSQGLDVAKCIALEPDASAAYVTPSHQFPTGVLMSMERRASLIDWANETGAWIFEDDYDSEFRYSGPPVTALAGLSPERVIYLGTFTKTLFPSLRLGYVVVPPNLLERVLNTRATFDRFPPAFLQDAVADLMADGTIAKHLRRNLRRYRFARDLVAERIDAFADGALRPEATDQGLHMIAWLQSDIPADCAEAIREKADVECLLFSETCMIPSDKEGFLIGFSGHSMDALDSAAIRLATAAKEAADFLRGGYRIK